MIGQKDQLSHHPDDGLHIHNLVRIPEQSRNHTAIEGHMYETNVSVSRRQLHVTTVYYEIFLLIVIFITITYVTGLI